MGGKSLLGLLGAGVLLMGYTVGWYGFLMLQKNALTGPGVQGGVGFLDLLIPGRNAQGQVDAKLKQQPNQGSPGTAPPQYAPGQVTIPGPTQSPLPQIPGYRPAAPLPSVGGVVGGGQTITAG